MWKSIFETLKDVGKVIYNFIKSVAMFFSAVGKGIYTCIKYVVSIVKGFFIFIKSIIDFFYKLVFMLFVCAVGVVIYKIYNNASDINKKLDEVKSNIQSILSFTNKSNELLNNINSLSILNSGNKNNNVKNDATSTKNNDKQNVEDIAKNDTSQKTGTDRGRNNINDDISVDGANQETKKDIKKDVDKNGLQQQENKKGIKQYFTGTLKKIKAWMK